MGLGDVTSPASAHGDRRVLSSANRIHNTAIRDDARTDIATVRNTFAGPKLSPVGWVEGKYFLRNTDDKFGSPARQVDQQRRIPGTTNPFRTPDFFSRSLVQCDQRRVVSKLVSLRDKKVDVALACNGSVALPLLQSLLAKNSEKINEALSTNDNIDDEIFNALLAKEDKVIQLLLLSQSINSERLVLIDAQALDSKLFATIGANECLESDVIDKLINRDNEELIHHLAGNATLSVVQLENIYAKGMVSSFEYLAINPAASVEMLEMLYKKYDESTIRIALAHNKSTPEAILRVLFERDEFEIYKSMASNSSLPMELLDILKVDTRLQNELAENEIFVKEYETVLDYDKKAVQF